ncbi:MAG: hypothetical protein MI923_23970 [Phycisphaerales bacterium]|nr:hypothetical protein [Phycisphaerales bacterium]
MHTFVWASISRSAVCTAYPTLLRNQAATPLGLDGVGITRTQGSACGATLG